MDNHCCQSPQKNGPLTDWRIKSEWQDETSLLCIGVAVPPHNSVLSITVSNSRTELFDTFSYALPIMIMGQRGSGITPINNGFTQGRILSIAAVNLGHLKNSGCSYGLHHV